MQKLKDLEDPLIYLIAGINNGIKLSQEQLDSDLDTY